MNPISGCGSRGDFFAQWELDPYESKESGDLPQEFDEVCSVELFEKLGAADENALKLQHKQLLQREIDRFLAESRKGSEEIEELYEQCLRKAVDRLFAQSGKSYEEIEKIYEQHLQLFAIDGHLEQMNKDYEKYLENKESLEGIIDYFVKQGREERPEEVSRHLIELFMGVVFNSGCAFTYKGVHYFIAYDDDNGVVVDRVTGKIDPSFLGTFSEVSYAESVTSGEKHVAKNATLRNLKRKNRAKEYLKREHSILREIHKDNAGLVGIQEKYSHFINSYWRDCSYGSFLIKELDLCVAIGPRYEMDLENLMIEWKRAAKDPKVFVQEHRAAELFIAWQLLLGLAYLHKIGCIHSDIKLPNILCNRNFNGDPHLVKAVLADFGATYFPNKEIPSGIVTTPDYIMESEDCAIRRLHEEISTLERLPNKLKSVVWSNSYRKQLEVAGRKADIFALGTVVSLLFRNIYPCEIDQNTCYPRPRKRAVSCVFLPAELKGIIDIMTMENMLRGKLNSILVSFSQAFDRLSTSDPEIAWHVAEFSPEMLSMKQRLSDYTKQIVPAAKVVIRP